MAVSTQLGLIFVHDFETGPQFYGIEDFRKKGTASTGSWTPGLGLPVTFVSGTTLALLGDTGV